MIQQQLSAQVWPYVSVDENINGNTVELVLTNNGLGPAIVRSLSITVDGKPQPDFIEVMHAILGPNIMGRRPSHEKISLALSAGAPGNVIRPGDSTVLFALNSKHFATPFLRAYRRLNLSVCYCAILPNTCWQTHLQASSAAEPVRSCPDLAHDLLHTSAADALTNKF